MASTLIELTASIVSSHAGSSKLSNEELIQTINKVHATLKQLETEGGAASDTAPAGAPVMSMKKAFQNDQIACLVCGKTGFKTLTRHLKQAHDLKPGQYRKQFDIPQSQSLTAKVYSEARRKSAQENNLAANLEKARAARTSRNKAASKTRKASPAPAATPVLRKKSAKPARSGKKS